MNGLLHHLGLSLKLNFRSMQAILYGYLVPIFFLFALGTVFASKPPLQHDMGRLLTITILGGACFGMPTTMVAERERGVWRRYRLLPISTAAVIVSAMLARFFLLLSAALMQIVLARIIFKTSFPNHPLEMLGAFVFVCFAFLGLGLVIAMVADNVPAVQAMGQAIFLPLIIIGGVGVKLENLPHWAQHIASFFPGVYAVKALQLCQDGDGLSKAALQLLSLTVIGVAALFAGTKMFRWDVGQKLTRSAKAWVAAAVLAWGAVGLTAEVIDWRTQPPPRIAAARPRQLKLSELVNPTENVIAQIVLNRGLAAARSVDQRALVARLLGPGSEAMANSVPTTLPATAPAVAVAPAAAGGKLPWEKVTKEQIESVTYDDLPDDNSTNTPLAPDLNGLDDDGKKRMDNFGDALSDWAPGKVEDIPQRIRNLLSICAVADIAEDPNEAHIPYIVFNYLKGSMPKEQLIHALTWVILNDREGTVLTNVKDIKELALDAEVQEDNARERMTLYGKKLLFRLLGKKPAN